MNTRMAGKGWRFRSRSGVTAPTHACPRTGSQLPSPLFFPWWRRSPNRPRLSGRSARLLAGKLSPMTLLPRYAAALPLQHSGVGNRPHTSTHFVELQLQGMRESPLLLPCSLPSNLPFPILFVRRWQFPDSRIVLDKRVFCRVSAVRSEGPRQTSSCVYFDTR